MVWEDIKQKKIIAYTENYTRYHEHSRSHGNLEAKIFAALCKWWRKYKEIMNERNVYNDN
jgi:hypothetical protein